jgi:hypothetical protein
MNIRRSLSHRIFPYMALLVIAQSLGAAELGASSSGRHFTLNGKPFFWLGDTVWLFAQLPSRDELEVYLRTRAEQGFTVIQLTAVMGEERVWGTTRATTRGDLPFIDKDVLKPAVTPGNNPADATEYDYWDHLDYVLERIHAHGFRAALVTYFVGSGGDGYKFLTKDNAHRYGRFLGERYRGKPEMFWILGGDNTPRNDDQKSIWPLVAKGIAEGLTGKEDYSQVMMTYHINGGASSAQHWHDAQWLDFNMAQTWSDYQNIYSMVRRDYGRTPAKPCGLGEGAYEDGPQYPTKPINGLVIRKQACWSWFAGGYHTYGNGNVWHFDSYKGELTEPWKKALHSRGAATLGHLKNFLTSFDWWNYVPDQSILAEGKGSGAKLNVAMRNSQGDAVVIYVCSSTPVKLNPTKIKSDKVTAKWLNPATGERKSAPLDNQPIALPSGWEDALLHITAN